MIASATEIVHALGELPNLAGRSHECDFPPEVLGLPVVTAPRITVSASSAEIDRQVREKLAEAVSIYEVLDGALERLRPTHILTQVQCEVCAVSLADVERSIAARLPGPPRVVSLSPNSLADIWDDIARVAAALGIPERGQRLVARLAGEIEEVSRRASALRRRPPVACLEWLEPLMAAGNWTPELVSLAGGVPVFGEPGRHSPALAWEDLLERDPDVMIAMPCGFDLERTRREIHWLTERNGFDRLRAVRQGRVYLADGNRYFNRPGPRVAECVAALAEMVHCGAPLEGLFCAQCGASAEAAASTAPDSAPALSDNLASALCYVLGLVTGVLFLVLSPYNRNRKIRFHAFQSIFFHLAWMILWYAVLIALQGFLLFLTPLVGLAFFAVWLYLIYPAYQGQKVVLPLIGPLAEQQA
ncbi:MAG: hypothetical protein FJW37_09270 [Acidobacteria bacterium]|nr:hypothetical protein [Acidobacteriota bacterium]